MPSALITSLTSTSPILSAVILPIQVPAHRAAPPGFDLGLGGDRDFFGCAPGVTAGVGVGLSSTIGAGRRCDAINNRAATSKGRFAFTQLRIVANLELIVNATLLELGAKLSDRQNRGRPHRDTL